MNYFIDAFSWVDKNEGRVVTSCYSSAIVTVIVVCSRFDFSRKKARHSLLDPGLFFLWWDHNMLASRFISRILNHGWCNVIPSPSPVHSVMKS